MSSTLGVDVAGAAPLSAGVAVVTGGASGIGRAAAVELGRAGADIAILDRDTTQADDACRELRTLGRRAEAVTIDLADSAAIPDAVASVLERFERIDILVNAAGVEGGRANVLELDLDTWERTHRVDLTAPFLLIQQCGRAMVAAQRGGRIVNVTSSSAFRASLTAADYASAKSGMLGLTRAAAAQLAQYDINVNCVAPGLTVTPTILSKMTPEHIERLVAQGPLENLFQRASTSEDVASTIVFLCLAGSRQITGQTIHTSAGAVV